MVGGTHKGYKGGKVTDLAKRYIDTKIWDKAWFRRLAVEVKGVWLYLITRCDHAGILDFDYDSFNFHLSVTHSEEMYLKLFEQFEGRILLYENNTKVWVKTFIDYQYGGLENLNANVRPQKAVIDRLSNQGLLDADLLTIDEESKEDKINKVFKTIIDSKEKLKKEFNDIVDVDYEIEKMIDWLKSSGKTYKDYEAFARNWLRNSKGYSTGNNKNSKHKPTDFKKEIGGLNIGYCWNCGKYKFYNDFQIYGDTKCCKNRIIPKRRKVHQEKVDQETKARGF